MLHPIIESLLFLKLARNSICESIDNSSIEEKAELKDYIQNEASDYEVIHLVTLGEMPENKFDDISEQFVWECFKKDMVKAFDFFVEEGYDEADIDRMIFEMGPVSSYGLSSAAPIMELHQHNGFFKEALKEGRTWRKLTGQQTIGDKADEVGAKVAGKWLKNSAKRRVKAKIGMATAGEKIATGAENVAMKGIVKADQGIKSTKKAWKGMSSGQQAGAKVGGAALGAGAAYLAYKAWKKRKAEKKKGKK
jgi:hypothetical protein